MLYETFRRIVAEAGVSEEYGYHDLRRAFASEVGRNLDGKRLQELMRHKDYETTKRYLNMRPSMDGITDHYEAPDLTRKNKRKPG